MKHAEHPMNAEDASEIFKDMQKRAKEPESLYGGEQVDPSSAHMTDREQWRYYGGKLRALNEVDFDLRNLGIDTVQAVIQAKISALQEMVRHTELRIEAKRHGVDYPSESH